MKMETWEAITSRRNVRVFEDRAIPAGHLDRILEAGRRSPSAKNWQPWDFVVVVDPDRLGELATVWKGAGHVADAAAAVALVVPDLAEEQRRERAQFDLGQATAAMQIVAADLGIGSGHAGVGDQPLARRILGLPADRRAALLLDFGYPGDRPLRPETRLDRRPFDAVVHRERW